MLSNEAIFITIWFVVAAVNMWIGVECDRFELR